MTPIAQFIIARLGEKRMQLTLDPGSRPLADHAFENAAVQAMYDILPDHMQVEGEVDPVCRGCRRFYPCRPALAMAAAFHDHPDYVDSWRIER